MSIKTKHRPAKFIPKWNTITRKSMLACIYYNLMDYFVGMCYCFVDFILHCYRNKANILSWQKRFYVLIEISNSSIGCYAQAHTHKSDCVVVVVDDAVVFAMFVFTFSNVNCQKIKDSLTCALSLPFIGSQSARLLFNEYICSFSADVKSYYDF